MIFLTIANALENYCNADMDAIVVVPADSAGQASSVKKASETTPIVTMDISVEGDAAANHVGINNTEATAQGAAWMAEKIGGKGNVVMVNGKLETQTGRERRDGFYNYMSDKYPDIKIYEFTANYVSEEALSCTENALVALEKIDGIFYAWDGGTMAGIQAIEQAGRRDEMLICGFDGAADALAAMQEGRIDADVAQPLYLIGYNAISNAVAIAKGETLDKVTNIETSVVTPDRIEQYIQEAHLAEFFK